MWTKLMLTFLMSFILFGITAKTLEDTNTPFVVASLGAIVSFVGMIVLLFIRIWM